MTSFPFVCAQYFLIESNEPEVDCQKESDTFDVVTERSYQQRCPIARALDVVGERWALLIVRELALGPARYGDLLKALPAMGTKVLAERLKELVARRVIDSTEAGYELTAHGATLLPVLAALAVWGVPLLERDEPGDTTALSSVALLILGRVVALPKGKPTIIQLQIEQQPFVLEIARPETRVQRGQAEGSDGTMSFTVGAAIDLLDGKSSLTGELARGSVLLTGLSPRRVHELFSFRLK
jgi:DNA-binding HxlR family transcriptional regulator